MSAERPTQPTSADRERDQGGSPDGAPPRDASTAVTERYGPVALERMAKEDGRQLILYTRLGELS